MSYTTNTNWTEAKCRREIVTQLERWNKDEWNTVGDKYDFPVPQEVGGAVATIRFELRGVAIVVSCDSQHTYRQNLRCVAFAIEAMRMNEKRGIADTLRKAYLMLEAPAEAIDPYELLGVRPDAAMEIVEAAYRSMSKHGEHRHPDLGGSEDRSKELNDAYGRIQRERNSDDG